MHRWRFMILAGALALWLWGCASPEPARVAPPPVDTRVHYFVGRLGVSLKSAPDPGSSDVAPVALNERVESLERGAAGWFQVRTADGRQGWISDRYLKIDPVTQLYVRRWGARLREAPESRGKTIVRMRVNDQVKLVDQQPGDWVKVTVERTQNTGWVEMRDLSLDRVVLRARKRKPAAPGTPAEAAEEAAAEEAAPEEAAPAKPSVLEPAKAEAAPPPAEKAPPRRKAKPGMFEPF